jgi:hypothetical protein
MQANLPGTLTRSSIHKNGVFLPLVDALRDLIADSIADQNGQESLESETREERYFQHFPVAQEIDEGREEEEEQELSDDDDDEDYDEDDEFFNAHEYRLAGYRMNYYEFALLTERLPRVVDGFTVKYELVNSELYVKTHLSAPHERAAEAVKNAILEWQRDPTNPSQPGNTLDSEGGAGKPPSFSQLFTNLDRLCL